VLILLNEGVQLALNYVHSFIPVLP